MPNMELAGNKKSAICKNANDTLVTLLTVLSLRLNSDTNIDSIAEFCFTVNPNERSVARKRTSRLQRLEGYAMRSGLEPTCLWQYG